HRSVEQKSSSDAWFLELKAMHSSRTRCRQAAILSQYARRFLQDKPEQTLKIQARRGHDSDWRGCPRHSISAAIYGDRLMKDLKQSPSQKKSGLFTQPRLLALGLLTAAGVFSGGACSNGPGQPVATGGSGSISTTCEPACGTGQTCNQGVCQCQGGV